MVSYSHHEADYHSQNQQSAKQGYQFAGKSKNQSLTLSDDEEPGFTAENSAEDGKRKASPWQRMKWTDNMVRLLIMVVYYIGDEVGSEGNDQAGKKKGGGVLQKKGKWKSVSRAMMERGFYVSPQQCEDKFNDLNKRYKRVNDILGKGTSCRVVENQSLLDTMDHLLPKMKEEVKKLLNSKHLFFREMCAYHNSCGHGASGSGTGGVPDSSPEAAAEPLQAPQQLQQQRCLHSTESALAIPSLNRGESEGYKPAKAAGGEDDDDGDDDDDEDEEEEEEEDEGEDGDEVIEGGSRAHDMNCGHEDVVNDADGRPSRKRPRTGTFVSPLIQQMGAEIMNILQDGTKSPSEKRQWMKVKLMQLEEKHVGFQSRSLELEKQRLKWLKFSNKKERDMEREKLTNERLKLENQRMVLLIRQKEVDLLDLQQQPVSALFQQEG
jgi:hypothetical protein